MVLFHGLAPCDGFESIIREIIENVYGRTEAKGISYASLLDRQLARLSELRENRSLTAEELRELAYDETIAEMSETMLTDTDAAQRVSQELYKQDRTLWEKIRDFFTGLVEKLKNAYKGIDPDSDMGRVMKRAISDNEKVAQAWAEAVVEAGENYQLQDGQKNNARGGERFSARQYQADAARFAQEIDRWNRDGMESGVRFELGSTGEVLQGLGAIESDIYMNGDKIQKILQEHPEITLNEIKQIPQILNDPTLILKSRNVGRGERQNTRMVLFGSVKGQNGMPVLTVFDLRPSENHFVLNDMQKVTSAYTKTNGVSFLENSFVLYADKKRTTSLLRSIGFQMPIELLQSGFIGTISYNQRSVNLYGEKFSDVVGYTGERYSSRNVRDAEYMELAKDPEGNREALSEMVKQAARDAGYTEVAYHGTHSDFTVFDKKTIGNNFGAVSDLGFYFTPYYEDARGFSTDFGKEGAHVLKGALRFSNPLVVEDTGWGSAIEQTDTRHGDLLRWAREGNHDGIIVRSLDDEFQDDDGNYDTVYVAFDSNQFKVLDPVTYDDNGNVIPLSQRFDTGNEDIRYSSRNNQESQVDRLARKNEELKAEAEYLRQVVQIQKQGNRKNLRDRESVNAIAKSILESVNAKDTEFGKKLNDFYRDMVTVEMDYDTMREKAGVLADRVLEHHQAERDGYAQEVLDFLKKRRVSLTESQIGDAEYTYGSLSEFKKAIRGEQTK